MCLMAATLIKVIDNCRNQGYSVLTRRIPYAAAPSPHWGGGVSLPEFRAAQPRPIAVFLCQKTSQSHYVGLGGAPARVAGARTGKANSVHSPTP